ncbi:MAG: Radical SAM superfamily protein [Candidatus Bathyarchaeota archaeon BA1]|nr:MAG: Radical SAM superfamily protein [Candidatus Bathyarchaeota archaeon BA1]
MTISELHLLLTYQCTRECDHCFVFGSPYAKGVMTIADVRGILSEAEKLGTIKWIYFEGGEPFLYYPIMLRGIKEANDKGFKTGIVTDPYWATSIEDAIEWLVPISKLGLSDLSISEDTFHQEEDERDKPKNAVEAARRLGLPVGTITIEEPTPGVSERAGLKGETVTGGEVMFRGRAVEKLVKGLPRKPWTEFRECRHEDLKNPSRVHTDPFGFIHLCQGLTLGNHKEEPLSKLIQSYDPASHPICGPLIDGGPTALVKKYDAPHEDSYVDECHLCYSARLALRRMFPKYLAPAQMYGEL